MLKLNLSEILSSPRDLLTLRLGKYLRTHLVLKATTLHLEMLPLINSGLFLRSSPDPFCRRSSSRHIFPAPTPYTRLGARDLLNASWFREIISITFTIFTLIAILS
jgi:hypothetical protein